MLQDIENFPKVKNQFPETRWHWQFVIGIICAFLNVAFSDLSRFLNLHLFLDVIFTFFASWVGWLCGFICCFFYHVVILLALHHSVVDMFWGICGFSILLLVKLFFIKYGKIRIVELLLFSLISTIVISVEGGILSTIMITKFNFQEDKEVMSFLVGLMREQIPLFFSSFLSRIPLNLLDKSISVFTSWGLFLWYRKLNKGFPGEVLFHSQN